MDPRLEEERLDDRRKEARPQPGPLEGSRRAGDRPPHHVDLDERPRQPRRQQPLRRTRHPRRPRTNLLVTLARPFRPPCRHAAILRGIFPLLHLVTHHYFGSPTPFELK